MRNFARSFVATLVLAASAALPMQARAVTFEDSFENCSYPKMTDLWLVRPIALGGALLGTGLFVPLGLLGALTVPSELGTIFDSLVSKPWAFVANRPLGECSSVTLDY